MKYKQYLLINDELLTMMYKDGFLSYKFFTYRAIYFWVDAQVKSRGISKRKAIVEAEIIFDVSQKTIHRALKGFQ